MKYALISAALLVSACHGTNVYDEPIPNRNDTQALLNIRDHIKPADQDAWLTVLIKMVAPAGAPIQSKTVGEAITHAKARTACLEAHDDNACANINI
jgi:hypothetical protein